MRYHIMKDKILTTNQIAEFRRELGLNDIQMFANILQTDIHNAQLYANGNSEFHEIFDHILRKRIVKYICRD